MAALSWFIPGGKPTNGGSASWCRGFWDRTAPVHRRPVDQDFRQEVQLETNLFVSHLLLHLHWTIPNHRKLNSCLLRCIWSPATRQQVGVPRFREKANLLRAHVKSSHSAQTEADTPKNINKRLFSPFFWGGGRIFIIFFVILLSLGRKCVHNSSCASWDLFDSLGCFTAGFFFPPQARVMQF